MCGLGELRVLLAPEPQLVVLSFSSPCSPQSSALLFFPYFTFPIPLPTINRILFNPNLLQCPDYTTANYAPTRALFVNDNVDHEQAVVLMTAVWRAANDRDRELWQNQVRGDLADQADLQLQQQAAQQQEELAALQEQEATRKEEMKRNKAKYAPIPDRPRPVGNLFIASNFAIQKLAKGLFLELWYYTNDGLNDAVRSQSSVDDEAMVMTNDPGGTTSWVPAATARTASKVRDDKDLKMEDLCHAIPQMIVAMEDADWPPTRVNMLATFWANILSHPY